MSIIEDNEHYLSMLPEARSRIRAYIVDSLLLGTEEELAEAPSLIEAGVLDSTGSLELVGFLEQAFAISVSDAEMVRDNLDSLDGIARFVARKIEARESAAALP